MNVSSLSEAANAPATAGKPYREREIWYISLIFETLSAHCCCWAVRIIITSRSIVICYRSLPVEHEYNRPPLFSCLFIPLFFPPFSFFNTRRQTGSFAIAIVSDGGYWKKGKKDLASTEEFYSSLLLRAPFFFYCCCCCCCFWRHRGEGLNTHSSILKFNKKLLS